MNIHPHWSVPNTISGMENPLHEFYMHMHLFNVRSGSYQKIYFPCEMPIESSKPMDLWCKIRIRIH